MKKILKKSLALVLVLVLMFAMAVPCFAVATNSSNLNYSQLPEGKRPQKPKDLENEKRVNHTHALDKSITDRPKEVKARQVFGHWEMDTVEGTKNNKKNKKKKNSKKNVLLVLTERKTKMEIVRKMKNKTAAETVKTLDRIQRQYSKYFPDLFKTITVDNGVEFSSAKGIEKNNRTQVYYCHPYSSWERGQNENANRLIRRFVPKGTSIHKYTHEQIAHVERWMNCYPRQMLDWQRPIDLFKKELKALNIPLPDCMDY